MHMMKQANTIFIALPANERRTIEWGCECPYCLNHPDRKPQWDTLSIDANGSGRYGTVHYPEFAE